MMNKYTTLFVIISAFLFSNTSSNGQSLLWEISGNGLEESSYLFGTYPLRDKRIFEINDSVFAKIDECDAFATPVLDTPEKNKRMNDLFSLEEGESLENFYSSSQLDFIKNFFENELKISFDFLEKTNPSHRALIGLGFLTQEKNTQKKSILNLLKDYAQEKSKQRVNFEPLDLYIKMFEESDPENLLIYIKKNELITKILEKRINAYLKDDIDGFVEPYFSYPFFMKLIDPFSWERNIVASDSIDILAKRHSTFFAIDAGHLASEKGVIKLLEKKGYILKPIIANKSSAIKKLQQTGNEDFTNWQLSTIKKFNCSIEFPEKPVFNVEEISDSLSIYSVSLESESQPNSLYSIQMIEFPSAIIDRDSMNQKELSDFYLDNLNGYVEEIGSVKKIEPMKIKIGQYDGMYVDVSVIGGLIKSRFALVLIENKQYFFNIITEEEIENNQALNYFLNSFKILNK